MAGNVKLIVIQLVCIVNTITSQLLEEQRIESYSNCRFDSDCQENSFCFGNDDNKWGKCKCKDGFELNRNRTNYECLKAVKLGDACERDFQCKVLAGPMARCSDYYNICECNDLAHSYTDGLCYKSVKLTEPCLSDQNCKLSNGKFGFCTDGHCDCNLNERPSLDLTTCLFSKRLGDECTSSNDCQLIPNSICSQVCKCGTEFVFSRDGEDCLKAAIHFGEPCVEDDQCSKFLYRSVCNNNNCTCEDGNHGYGNKCIRSARADEACAEDAQCVFDRLLENKVYCTEGYCQCVFEKSDDAYGCKFSSLAGLVKPSLVLNSFFILGFLYIFHM